MSAEQCAYASCTVMLETSPSITIEDRLISDQRFFASLRMTLNAEI